MTQRMARRITDDDRGFTLIELLVVVTIIAVLIAIAIPMMLGARSRAQDRAAQTAARNAITEAMAVFTDNSDFSRADQATLQSDEPSLQFVGATASVDPAEVSTASACVGACGLASKHNRFVAAVKSSTGKCWFAQSIAESGVSNSGVTWEQATGVDCEAANAPAFDSSTAPSAWAPKPGDSLP
jgi:type IV pilus assembly protein PilA